MRALEDIRILDLTRYFSGPQATLLLAGLGAEVIRIDDPRKGDPVASAPPFVGPNGVSFARSTKNDLGIAYLKRARGKKSVTLDLKSKRGIELFRDLVESSDVLIENFAPGVTERLGIDYDSLSTLNPTLVYCSVTGYGSVGPDAHLKAYDATVQAASGLMSITGSPEGSPTKAGSSISDGIAGIFAVSGILAALHERERSQRGQHVDLSMVDALFSLIFDEPLDCYEQLDLPLRMGNRIMRFSPFNSFPTKDGWIVVGAATTEHWHSILRAIGRRDLIGDPRFENTTERLSRNEEVESIIEAWCKQQESVTAIQQLRSYGAICEQIRDVEALKSWTHLQARGMLVDLEHPTLGTLSEARAPGFPIKFSRTPTQYERPAPTVGEHNEEVLNGLLGVSYSDLEQLESEGII